MKPLPANQKDHGFTLIELLVVIAVLVIFLGLIDWGVPPSQKRKAQLIACISHLKEIGAAFRLWEGDHGDKYPMAVSVTNGGAMELVAAGNITACFQAMSNELSAPQVLLCPADTHRTYATDFSTGFSGANISYFLNPDATGSHPQMIMLGDDNLLVDGKPVHPGILSLRPGQTITWTKDRHPGAGNIGLADGSVQPVTTAFLQKALQQTDITTNHLVLP